MPSEYTVRIHLPLFLKNYVIKVCSKNKHNPIIFEKGSRFIKLLRPLLISKREYEHRKIVEIEAVNHGLVDYIEIKLPWMGGKIDIRYKHYISPLDEKKFRQYIRDDFTYIVSKLCKDRISEGSTYREAINGIKKSLDITEDRYFKSFSNNLYRKIKKGTPFRLPYYD
jgi:hypothetical protein